ncbi:MAG: hypothetical protein M1497_00445 [Nitrospirae bacterium]|nr:hypothetical protein [Nitrospirota bacterium]
MLATPLTAAAVILVKMLYIEDDWAKMPMCREEETRGCCEPFIALHNDHVHGRL